MHSALYVRDFLLQVELDLFHILIMVEETKHAYGDLGFDSSCLLFLWIFLVLDFCLEQ